MMQYEHGGSMTFVCKSSSPGSWMGMGKAMVNAMARKLQSTMHAFGAISGVGNLTRLNYYTSGHSIGWIETFGA